MMPGLTTTTEKGLSERHRHMLEVESCIAPEVISARGYWTAETVDDLKGVDGISQNQYYAPALVLPIHGVDGKYRYSRVRPDNPPPNQGKYIQPADTLNVLDIPRTVQSKVMDPIYELVVVEGERKGDALASLDIPVVVVFGVWNWSCKAGKDTPYETQLLLPDFEFIPLHGRSVALVFDADIHTNRSIQLAVARCAHRLKERGAQLW
jgi:hypothetical protein